MDPRNKILCLIALMVAVFISYEKYVMTFVVGGAIATFIIAILLIARVRILDVFKSLRVLWFFVLLLMIINVFTPPAGSVDVAFHIGKVNVYWDAVFQSLKIILRLVLMIMLTMVLTATTKPLDLTYALEWYMTPLKLIKFPVHEIAMTISIALRFIPTLLDETDRIMKAQSSRGVDFKHGKLSSRLRAIVSLIIPLFVSSFQRSEELADSMEARGYDPKAKRTRYRVLKFTLVDLSSIILVSAVLTGVIFVSVYRWDLGTAHFVPWWILTLLLIFLYMLISGLLSAVIRRHRK
jgi:energy-coupling factor transport system permease protein